MFVVVFDANVLYSAATRDLLVRLARTGIVQARWTDDILDEAFAAILRKRPDLNAGSLARTRELLCKAVPDCLVTGHDVVELAVTLPDPDDMHVLAAAVRCGAQGIVTRNTKDFPAEVLAPLDIEAQHPDVFVLGLIDLDPGAVTTALHQQQKDLRNPPVSMSALLEVLEKQGLVQSVAAMRQLLFD